MRVVKLQRLLFVCFLGGIIFAVVSDMQGWNLQPTEPATFILRDNEENYGYRPDPKDTMAFLQELDEPLFSDMSEDVIEKAQESTPSSIALPLKGISKDSKKPWTVEKHCRRLRFLGVGSCRLDSFVSRLGRGELRASCLSLPKLSTEVHVARLEVRLNHEILDGNYDCSGGKINLKRLGVLELEKYEDLDL